MPDYLELSAGDTVPISGKVNADLTGASVEVEVTRADGTTFTRPATVTNAKAGAWSFTPAADSLTVPGFYKVVPVVDYSDESHQTFEVGDNYFRVRG